MSMHLRRSILPVVLLLLVFDVLQAQYTVSLRLIDQNRESIAGATVSFSHVSDTARKWMWVSDSLGMVRLAVPKARYRLKVEAFSHDGFKMPISID